MIIKRKKRLRIIQFGLLFVSLIILYFSYSDQFRLKNKNIISEEIQDKINKQLLEQTDEGDTFYNITFNGLDLSGNRYILNAKEAKNDKKNLKKFI